jgi:hypothetical protein
MKQRIKILNLRIKESKRMKMNLFIFLNNCPVIIIYSFNGSFFRAKIDSKGFILSIYIIFIFAVT